MRGMKIAALSLALLCAAIAGCTTSSTVTEGDRLVQDQTEKAGVLVQDKIKEAQTAIGDGNLAAARSLLEMGALAGGDIVENMAQQRAVHGAPKEPKPYSPENSKAARESSQKDHTSSNWLMTTLTIAGTVLGIASTCAGMPFLAPIFPALAGKLGKWATTGSQIITAVRAKAEEAGGSIHVQDILAIAKDKNVSAGIQNLVSKRVDAHEEAMGHDFQIKLDSPPAEVEAATPQ